MTSPIAWELLENAIHDWVVDSTGLPGDKVYFVEPESAGASEPPAPAAQISLLSGPLALGQEEKRKIPSTVIQRLEVLAIGPGNVGINLYVGYSEVPLPIVHVADVGESIADAAAGLLVELVANLPDGITASADPADAAWIQIIGSTDVPLFASAPVDPVMLRVTPLRERWPTLALKWSRMTWRVAFRSGETRGPQTAAAMMASTQHRTRLFLPRIHAAGWQHKGTLAALAETGASRTESTAALDFAIEGYSTDAYQSPAGRLIGFSVSPTQ